MRTRGGVACPRTRRSSEPVVLIMGTWGKWQEPSRGRWGYGMGRYALRGRGRTAVGWGDRCNGEAGVFWSGETGIRLLPLICLGGSGRQCVLLRPAHV